MAAEASKVKENLIQKLQKLEEGMKPTINVVVAKFITETWGWQINFFLFLAEKIVTELEAQREKLEKVRENYCLEFIFN
jgi:hypothetical protein